MASFNLLKKLSFTTASAACIALGAVTTAQGATIIDTTTNWDGISHVGSFGESEMFLEIPETFGQTFTVGSDNILNDFSFWVDDNLESSAANGSGISPDFIDFAAYIMAWDGTKATGNILYQSGPQSTTGLVFLEDGNTTGVLGMQQFTFNTGGLSLTPGQQYVAFLSASNFLDGIDGFGYIGGDLSDSYSGGQFVFANNGSNFNALTTQNWDSSYVPNSDAAFKAIFTSSNSLKSVPEPASVLGLIAIGSWGASQILKRKKEQ